MITEDQLIAEANSRPSRCAWRKHPCGENLSLKIADFGEWGSQTYYHLGTKEISQNEFNRLLREI